jgi:hypothetical protein
VFNRTWRTGPLSVDPPTTLVEEHGGVAHSRVQLGVVVRDKDEIDVVPGPCTDAIARVRRLIVVRRIALDTEIGPPTAIAVARGRREALTGGVGAAQAAKLPVTLVALVTKKLTAGPDGDVGPSSQPALIRNTSRREQRFIILAFLDSCTVARRCRLRRC